MSDERFRNADYGRFNTEAQIAPALPPDLREAVETAKKGYMRRHSAWESDAVPSWAEIDAAREALALIEQRLMEYCTALEIIRDKRREGGSKLISGREAEAIASAALPKENP